MKKFHFQIIVTQNRYTKKKFQKEKSRTYKKDQNSTARYRNYLRSSNATHVKQLITLHQNSLTKVIPMIKVIPMTHINHTI